MDDKQLAILLDKYHRMIESAIAEVEKNLPKDCMVEGKNLFQDPIKSYPILDKFYTLDCVMKGDIELLTGQVSN